MQMITNTETLHVPSASIWGMVVSLIVSVGLPIVLLIVIRKKTKARISSFFIGSATFVVFALILEQILHMVVLKNTGTLLTGNIWLYALYGGLAAGIFEETGRYLAMKFCMRKNLNKQNAIMYGAGHGGIEAILIVGLSSISNIITAAMINNGQLLTALSVSGVDEATYQSTISQLSALWTTPSWQFYVTGLERISAIIFHIAASYLVYLAVRNKKISWYLLAVLAHFLMDAITVVTANYLPILAVELVLLAFCGGFGYMVWRKYRTETNSEI